MAAAPLNQVFIVPRNRGSRLIREPGPLSHGGENKC